MSPPARDDEGPLPWGVVIPDDIRELDAEVHAVRREVRRQRRRTWLTRRPLTRLTRRRNSSHLSGPLVALTLIGVALVGCLVALLGPRPSPAPAPGPLAHTPQATPGEVAGLLPAARVQVRGQWRDVRGLRPAVFALLPPSCDCAVTVESLFRQAREYQVDFYLVGTEARAQELRRLAVRTGNGSTDVVVDATERLAALYRPHGVTTVLVDRAGLVTAVERDLGPRVRLEPRLARLLRPHEDA